MTKKILAKLEIKEEIDFVEKVKDFIISSTKINFDPEDLSKKFVKKYLPKISTKTISPNRKKEAGKEAMALSKAFSTDTGMLLVENVDNDYRGFALQMRRDLQKEFNCTNTIEKALVDLIVNSFIRKLSYSGAMKSKKEYITPLCDNYRNYLSKEIDRAHRQFLSSLEALRFIKQPALRVNVKTNNAFIGENQQFNNNQNNEAK